MNRWILPMLLFSAMACAAQNPSPAPPPIDKKQPAKIETFTFAVG